MITDYHRGGAGQGNDSGLADSLKSLSASYANMKAGFASASSAGLGGSAMLNLKDFALGAESADYSGGIDLGDMGNFSAGSFGGMSRPGDTEGEDESIFTTLINLIVGVIKLPNRFRHMMQASMSSVEMLAKGLGGIIQSSVLGVKDIIILLFAILKLVAKYGKCILSFIITLPPCAVIHVITFLCYVIYYWLIQMPISLIETLSGISIMPMIDAALSAALSWPDIIEQLCYTCFGDPVKLTDVLEDVSVIQDVGDMIQSDFTHKIPRYLRPATPSARTAKAELDAAFA